MNWVGKVIIIILAIWSYLPNINLTQYIFPCEKLTEKWFINYKVTHNNIHIKTFIEQKEKWTSDDVISTVKPFKQL